MGCLPFCCCLQNFGPKVYAYIALACDIAKIVLTICSFFLLEFSIIFAGPFLSIFDFFPTIANIILMIVIIIKISNGSAFAQDNSCCICMCIASLIICGIIFVMRIIFFIEFIVAYNTIDKWIEKETKAGGASTSDWMKLIVPYILLFIIEIIHILAVIYLYRLLKIKSNVCYRDYLYNGPNVPNSPTTVTVSNDPMIKNPPIIPNQLPPPGYPNQLPPPGYPNQQPPSGYPNQLPPPGQQYIVN